MTTERNGSAGRERLLLAVGVLAAAVLQAAVVLRSCAIGSDGITFIRIARRLHSDPIEVLRRADQHPGYPALVAACHGALAVLGSSDPVWSWIRAGRAVCFLCGLVSVVLVYHLARVCFAGEAAALCAVLFSVFPLVRWNASDCMSDTPHLACYLAAALCAVRAVQELSPRYFAACGLLSACAYLIRPEGLAVAFVGAGACAWFLLRKQTRRQAAACLGGLVAVALLFVLPYVLLKGNLTGKKNFFTFFVDLYRRLAGHAPSGPRVLWKVGTGGRQVLHIFVEDAMRYVLCLPLLAGLFRNGGAPGRCTARRITGALLWVHVGLLFVLFWVAGYTSARNAIPLCALAMPWVGWGFVRAGAFFHRVVLRTERLKRAVSPQAIAFLLVAVTAGGLFVKTLRPIHTQKVPVVRAARYVALVTGPGESVWTNTAYGLFYAHREGKLEDTKDMQVLAGALQSGHWSALIFERKGARGAVPGQSRMYRQVVPEGTEPSEVLLFLRRGSGGDR